MTNVTAAKCRAGPSVPTQPYRVCRWLGHASVVPTDTIGSRVYPTDYAQHVTRFEDYVAEG